MPRACMPICHVALKMELAVIKSGMCRPNGRERHAVSGMIGSVVVRPCSSVLLTAD